MTMRFCVSCMTETGLDPARSRLALPGCSSARTAFCDGPLHDCTVLVDERGAIVPKAALAAQSANHRSAQIVVAGHSLLG